MVKKVLLPLIFLILIMSACSPGFSINPSPTPTSGVEGRVTEGPMCPGPVRIGDTSCQDQPYQATITVLDNQSNQITKIQTDANGYFIIPLEPGNYILHPAPGNPLPRAADQPVLILAGQYTQVTIMYDTGMR